MRVYLVYDPDEALNDNKAIEEAKWDFDYVNYGLSIMPTHFTFANLSYLYQWAKLLQTRKCEMLEVFVEAEPLKDIGGFKRFYGTFEEVADYAKNLGIFKELITNNNFQDCPKCGNYLCSRVSQSRSAGQSST